MWKTTNNSPAPDYSKTNNNKKNLYKITINYKLGTMAKTKLLYAIDAATKKLNDERAAELCLTKLRSERVGEEQESNSICGKLGRRVGAL